MFGIFKSSAEYMKLGIALDKAYSNGLSLIVQVQRSPDKKHSQDLIIAHCRSIRTEIVERINTNRWPLHNKILCLKINAGKITLAEAYQAILTQVFIIAERVGCTEDVSAILE